MRADARLDTHHAGQAAVKVCELATSTSTVNAQVDSLGIHALRPTAEKSRLNADPGLLRLVDELTARREPGWLAVPDSALDRSTKVDSEASGHFGRCLYYRPATGAANRETLTPDAPGLRQECSTVNAQAIDLGIVSLVFESPLSWPLREKFAICIPLTLHE